MKKRGFTLIELLAVIVVLAVIALITVPLLLNIIDKAKKGAAKASALNYVDAVEKYMVLSQLDNTKIKLVPGKVYQINKSDELSFIDLIIPKVYAENEEIYLNDIVAVKGEKPDKGWVIVSDKKVEYYSFVESGFVVTKDQEIAKGSEPVDPSDVGGESTPVVNNILPEGLTKGSPVYFNPEKKEICGESNAVSATGTKIGCMKWYVYKDNEDGTYQLILDHNTTAKVAYNSTGSNTNMVEVKTALETDTSSWSSDLNARLIMADEVAEITGANLDSTIKWNSSKAYGGQTIDTQSSWFYLDGGKNSSPTSYLGWQKQYSNATKISDYYWLYDYTNTCNDYGCKITDKSNYGYWTSTPYSSNTNSVWIIFFEGIMIGNSANNVSYCGVRPVITV